MRLPARVFTLVATCVLLAEVPVSQAATPQVERHDLQCGEVFPCPEEIQRRVDFWVQVFRQWGTGQRVIHDSERPEKVFSVLTTEDQCSAKRPGRLVRQEQDKIRDGLRSLASRVESGQPPENDFQRDLANLYPGASGQQLRNVVDRLRCQSGNRDRFAEALQRFGEYRPFVIEYLSDAGLSIELQYLPFVESAYHPKAYSHLGAAGIWQIMPNTARTLGLQISASVDERFDPQLATQGAIRYFQDSIKQLTRSASAQGVGVTPGRLNPFVVTSYNYGVRGMTRAVEQVGLDYIRLLNEYQSRTFRTAVKNFYASFLAARYVAKNANKYFPGINGNNAPKTSIVSIPYSASAKRLISVFKVDEAELKELNPSLTSRVWKGFSYVPAGFNLALPPRSDGWSEQRAELAALPYEGASDGGERHVVERGDTACEVAELYRVRCRDVIDLNQLGRLATIRIGQVLKIPGKGGSEAVVASTALQGGRHVVVSGQTPCGIANQYRVNCQAFLTANGLTMRSKIYVGQTMLVPGVGDTLSSATSHTVRAGQSPCSIAGIYRVTCDSILLANGLNRNSIIYVGQSLKIPGRGEPTVEVATSESESSAAEVPVLASASSADNGNPDRILNATGVDDLVSDSQSASSNVTDEEVSSPQVAMDRPAQLQVGADARLAPLYDWQNLAVEQVGDAYQISVLPEENLGYYADWLGIGPAGELRRLNNLKFGDVLEVGTRLKLPISDVDQLVLFEFKRKEFHSLLVDEYVQRFDISDLQSYRIQSGDTLWDISNDFDVPMWVLYRFNQGDLLATVGKEIIIPGVSDRE